MIVARWTCFSGRFRSPKIASNRSRTSARAMTLTVGVMQRDSHVPRQKSYEWVSAPAMLSGARSQRQIHALIDQRLARLIAAFLGAALRRAPAYPSVRGILRQLDRAGPEQAFRLHATGNNTASQLGAALFGAPSRRSPAAIPRLVSGSRNTSSQRCSMSQSLSDTK